jgi:hypothetical protein
MAHIEECLWGASPACAEAFNGKVSCAASGDPRDQEQNAMMETAQQLYEQYTQSGAPSLTLMDRIRERMMPMNFKVTKEAAGFATEARIYHMCTVANLIRACCFEGLASYSLVTSLGPEGLTEWKAALINEAAEKLPRLFGTLERDVRNGKFEPGEGALEYGHATPGYDINELIDKDMAELQKMLNQGPSKGRADCGEGARQSTSDGQGRRICTSAIHLGHPRPTDERRRPAQAQECRNRGRRKIRAGGRRDERHRSGGGERRTSG